MSNTPASGGSNTPASGGSNTPASGGSNTPTKAGKSTSDPSGGVQSVDRAISVLEILARRGDAGVSEIARDIGVHKSTAFRLLAALEDRGLVEQSTERGKYQLGMGLLRLAGAVPGRLDLVQQGSGVCEELAVTVGETVNIATLRSHFAVNVFQARGPAAIAAHNWVGEPTPLHATSSGKVLLAALTAPERKALLTEAGMQRFTEATLTSRRALETQLDLAASQGWAVTLEEYEVGLNAVAAPIFDHGGLVIAAISVAGPAYRLDTEQLDKITRTVCEAAHKISYRMGHLGD